MSSKGRARKKGAGKRRYMKMYSAAMVSTGKGPAPGAGYINDQGQLVEMTLGSRSRAAQTGVPVPWLDTLFPGVNSLDTPDKVIARSIGKGAVPRALVLSRLMQGEQRIQSTIKYVACKILDGKRTKLTLMLSGADCFFIKEEIKATGNVIQRSIMYSSKTNAMTCHDLNQVCWVERKTLPPNSG